MHIYREKIEIPIEPTTDGPEKKITRLAIGVEGGFDADANKKRFEYKDNLSIVVFPNANKIPYPNIDLPLLVIIIIHDCIDVSLIIKYFLFRYQMQSKIF